MNDRRTNHDRRIFLGSSAEHGEAMYEADNPYFLMIGASCDRRPARDSSRDYLAGQARQCLGGGGGHCMYGCS